MTDSTQQQPKKKRIREIDSIVVKSRIGPPNELEGQLEAVTVKTCDFEPEEHKVYGPGIWVRFKSVKGYVEFVPIGNVRRVNYTEREE